MPVDKILHVGPVPVLLHVVFTLAGLLLFGTHLSGCQSTNPVASARDSSQRAYALYGTFVIIEEQGAKLVQDPSTSTWVKNGIEASDARAKPSADALANALRQYEQAAAALKVDSTAATKMQTINTNLETWINQAEVDINSLVAAVHAQPGS